MCRIENYLLATPKILENADFWEDVGKTCVENFFGDLVFGEGKKFGCISNVFKMSIKWIDNGNDSLDSNDYLKFNITKRYQLHCKIIKGSSINNGVIELDCYELFENALILECASVIKQLFYFLDEYEVADLSNIIVKQAYSKATSDLKAYLWLKLSVNIDLLSTLSDEKYEKRNCNDFNLVFMKNDHKISKITEFCDIEINRCSIRQVRKLLELLNKKGKRYCLVFDKHTSHIIGIAELPKDPAEYDYRVVINNGSWSLYNGLKLSCKYDEHSFKVIQIDLNIYKLNPKVETVILTILNNCRHGALVFVFPDRTSVQHVVNDLHKRKRIYKLAKPVNSKKLIAQFCDIDGAIFLDNSGQCYGFGGICDGESQVSGTMERGARYNSAITAVHSYIGNPLAVIISEDGGIDFQYSEKCELIEKNHTYYA